MAALRYIPALQIWCLNYHFPTRLLLQRSDFFTPGEENIPSGGTNHALTRTCKWVPLARSVLCTLYACSSVVYIVIGFGPAEPTRGRTPFSRHVWFRPSPMAQSRNLALSPPGEERPKGLGGPHGQHQQCAWQGLLPRVRRGLLGCSETASTNGDIQHTPLTTSRQPNG